MLSEKHQRIDPIAEQVGNWSGVDSAIVGLWSQVRGLAIPKACMGKSENPEHDFGLDSTRIVKTDR